MILRHIEQIEARVRQSEKIAAESKSELLAQLAELKTEAEAVCQKEEGEPPLESSGDEHGPLTATLDQLSAAVDGLESSHPRLTQLTNQIALALANMGI